MFHQFLRRSWAQGLALTLLIYSGHASAAKTFVFCSEGNPVAFNGALVTDGTSSNANLPIYEGLTGFKEGETKVVPALAESWEIKDKGLKYIFKLRKNVSFHKTDDFSPTRKMNADDVLFSFNRQRLKDHPYHSVGGGRYEYFTGMEMDKTIKDIKKIDDFTVEFTLNEPQAPFLANLAMTFAGITSAEYGDVLAKKNQKDNFDIRPVGTGPFVFKSYQKDAQIRYVQNKEYYLGAPKIENLVFSITPDSSVRYQKLKTGECHLIYEPAPQDRKAIKENKQLKMTSMPGMNILTLYLNATKPPLNNVLVRQAINIALNKQSYVNSVFLGDAVVAKNPIPPVMWGANKNTPDIVFDATKSVAKAKELLKKAGFPDGIKEKFTLITVATPRPYNPNSKKTAELIQADLAKIGITVEINTLEWGAYLEQAHKKAAHLDIGGWNGDNGDPDNFMATLLSCAAELGGGNHAHWCFPAFDELIIKAKQTDKQSEREKLYIKAQEIFTKEVPWAPLAHTVTYRAMSNNVTGYKMSPIGHDFFYHVDLK